MDMNHDENELLTDFDKKFSFMTNKLESLYSIVDPLNPSSFEKASTELCNIIEDLNAMLDNMVLCFAVMMKTSM
jgi:hypothetical protein